MYVQYILCITRYSWSRFKVKIKTEAMCVASSRGFICICILCYALSFPTLLTLGLFSRFRDVFHYIQRKCVKIRFYFPTFIFKLNVWLREVARVRRAYSREFLFTPFSSEGLGSTRLRGYDRLRLSFRRFYNLKSCSSCLASFAHSFLFLSLCFPATLEDKSSRGTGCNGGCDSAWGFLEEQATEAKDVGTGGTFI